ncbi:MAG: MlaC/ttg2D family ABC transporter substrate-binding protein [Candidatus Rokuibacteriota bacterium]
MWNNLRTKARGAWQAVSSALIASPPAPGEVVRTALNRVNALLIAGESISGSASTVPGYVRGELRNVSNDVFDLEHMARGVLWRHWATRTAAERAEFVRHFTDLLERLYVPHVRHSRWVSVLRSSDVVDGNHATVKWKIGTLRMAAAIEYRLRLQDGRWRIFDVVLNGQSFVGSSRQEFDQRIRASSYAAVVREMPRWESLAFIGPGMTLAPTADSPEPARRGW